MSSMYMRRSPENAFSNSKLTIIPSVISDNIKTKSSSMMKVGDQQYSTKSYLTDNTSGRASAKFQILLTTKDTFDRNSLLKSGAIKPAPPKLEVDRSGIVEHQSKRKTADFLWSSELETLGEAMDDDYEQGSSKRELKFQCTCREEGKNSGKIIIEAVSILSTALVGNNLDDEVGIKFDVEVSLRDTDVFSERNFERGSKVKLEIRALLLCIDPHSGGVIENRWTVNKEDSLTEIFLGMKALDMGISHALHEASPYFCETSALTLPSQPSRPLHLDILLSPAFTITVREVGGASSHRGVTLLSVILSHSNCHDETVTVTNIALHPGHSRLLNGLTEVENSTKGKNLHGETMPGGEDAVINMSQFVRWGYVSGTAPSLPLVLQPHEAVATIIEIHGRENMLERYFVSPVCVKAVVGEDDNDNRPQNQSDAVSNDKGTNKCMVAAIADATWTTARIASGLTDAFRVNMSVEKSVHAVGSQILVSLKVMNLSAEPRDLMLLMAKDEDKSDLSFEGGKPKERSSLQTEQKQETVRSERSMNSSIASSKIKEAPDLRNTINTAVLYEVNGYVFGVWGLSGDDDGTVRYNRDHELLAVDAALLLGEIRGQHSLEAELRFVPLRDGTLDVPNLKLYDRIQGKWYDCIHTLKIVVGSKQ